MLKRLCATRQHESTAGTPTIMNIAESPVGNLLCALS